jgi:prepilin-type N-terminal cleavage/methylation domain-containing protein
MQTRFRRPLAAAVAFTLVELLVVLAVVGVLAALLFPTVARAKSKARASNCVNHLKHLGTAFVMYDVESDDRLPPAAWRVRPGEEMSWDDWLDRHLGGNLTAQEQWAASHAGEETMKLLNCPEAVLAGDWTGGEGPRSYAMPRYLYDPQRAPWPPRSRSRTGVGVVWDFRDGDNPDDHTAAIWELGEYYRVDGLLYTRPVKRQSAVSMGILRRPAETILLAERLGTATPRGGLPGATLDHIAGQLSTARVQGRLPHGDFTPYLMADGRVEPLRPEQTLGTNSPPDRQSGRWTISTRD